MPNPSYDYISFYFETDGKATATITNMNGEILFERSIDYEPGVFVISINISDWAVGQYRATLDNLNKKTSQCFRKL